MSKSIWSVSAEALKYVQARPSHPKQLVNNAVAFLKENYKGPLNQAVDVGCGTGISTVNLYGEFQSVIGLDASQAMIDQAMKRNLHGSLRFLLSSAEKLPIEENSTQLVIAGRAIHYFDTAKFYKEVDRILVDKGVLAFYSVDFPSISSANQSYGARIHEILWEYLTSRLQGYWPVNPYNGLVVDWRRREYYLTSLTPPYAEAKVDVSVSAQRETSVLQLARELETYSGFVILRAKEGDKVADTLLQGFLDECAAVLVEGEDKPGLVATDNFFMVMARKPA